MNNRGPIITLISVAALAAVLLPVNMTVQSQTASRTSGTPPAATTLPATASPTIGVTR